jgi:hypothetical protein
MAESGILRTIQNGSLGFNCPGCSYMHIVRVIPKDNMPCWGFNNNFDKPTFTPSILVRWNEGEDYKEMVCHSFVTDGNIQFLNDCTHKLAGQTVPLTCDGWDWFDD